MRVMYDFGCVDDPTHITEAFVESGTATTTCDRCGKLALRRLSAPRSSLEGITGAFPTAYDAWARKHEQAARIASKRDES